MIKIKFFLFSYLSLSIASTSFAEVIDYKDDSSINIINSNSDNFYEDDEVRRITIPSDPNKSIYKNKQNNSNQNGGLVLEGVDKDDLEDLYYGNELYQKSQRPNRR